MGLIGFEGKRCAERWMGLVGLNFTYCMGKKNVILHAAYAATRGNIYSWRGISNVKPYAKGIAAIGR